MTYMKLFLLWLIPIIWSWISGWVLHIIPLDHWTVNPTIATICLVFGLMLTILVTRSIDILTSLRGT